MMRARWRFTVRGRVQGVGFRRFVQRAATALGLVGFVRNEADGSVGGEAEGALAQLQQLQQELLRGPRFARVDEVGVAPVVTATSGETGFQVIR
ncbi:MAG: acylphosphatase [Planctomycetes bacterium]|nr:acylphosphatase [Planctomycetota bacterium]